MTIDTQRLRELAQNAYQGAWEVDTRSGDNIWAPDCNIMVQCLGDKSNVSAMTSFLGAATPSTVLALLDALDDAHRNMDDFGLLADKKTSECRSLINWVNDIAEDLSIPEDSVDSVAAA